VADCGRIFFRTSGHTTQTITITKPMNLMAYGGPVTIGR
jgi:hypothetical protein